MFIGTIVASSILIVAMLVVAIFIVSYGIYVKNRIFTKPKLSLIIVIIVGLIIAGLLFIGIYLATRSSKVAQKQHEYLIQSILVLVSALLMLVNYLSYIFITITNKSNKIDYNSIPTINWNDKINQLKANVDIEQLKLKLQKKNKNYYDSMLDSYKDILTRAKDPNRSDVDKMADIVVFNENFTHKWSKNNNNLQLLLTYEFCKIFNK